MVKNKDKELNPELAKLDKELKTAEETPIPSIESAPQEKRHYKKREKVIDSQEFLKSPFYVKLMEKKENMIAGILQNPLDRLLEYNIKKYPELSVQLKDSNFSDSEKAQLKDWGNTLYDLYAPDIMKHYKLVLTIAGIGTIASIYIGKIMMMKILIRLSFICVYLKFRQ